MFPTNVELNLWAQHIICSCLQRANERVSTELVNSNSPDQKSMVTGSSGPDSSSWFSVRHWRLRPHSLSVSDIAGCGGDCTTDGRLGVGDVDQAGCVQTGVTSIALAPATSLGHHFGTGHQWKHQESVRRSNCPDVVWMLLKEINTPLSKGR